MTSEFFWLYSAVACYLAAGLAIALPLSAERRERAVFILLTAGLGLQAASIGMRWERLGHGPFITLFEVLSSNVWSLTLAFTIAFWKIRAVRPAVVVVGPLLGVMIGWLLVTNPAEGHLPPTYQTPLLYLHVGLGKVFLGAVLIAVGISGLILLRGAGRAVPAGDGAPAPAPAVDGPRLEELAFRFMVLGFVFETAMLITGAIWAQDAWGRYWSWDPLETWSFVTWLALAAYVHARVTVTIVPRFSAAMIIGVFVIAFLTFFGVPFISTAPHKGAV